MRKNIIILVMVMLNTAAVAASEVQHPSAILVPNGAVIINVNAGTENRRGWYEAQSHNKRFSLQFPVPYLEWKASVDKLSSPALSLGAITRRQSRFLITEIPAIAGINETNMDQIIAELFKNETLLYSKDIVHQGVRGKEIKTNTSTSSKIYRYLFCKDVTYQLSVEYLKRYRSSSVPKAKKFFRSFDINLAIGQCNS